MKKKKIIGVKGFNKDMTCRDMKYEEGKIYKMDEKPQCCRNGYHFCENPIDCFNYYEPAKSVYHEVEATGEISKDDDSDTKIATNEIKIGAKINFQAMVRMAIDFTYKHCKKGGKGSNRRSNYSVASNTGYKSVASNTGDNSVASNTGNYSVAKKEGKNGISCNLGIKGQASGKKGTWLVLSEWVRNENFDFEVKSVKAIKVDGKKIKEDIYYALEDGKFVEKGAVEDD